MKTVFLTDFDGTVTNDVLTAIFEKYASADWESVFLRYRRGEIGSRQLYKEITPMLRVQPKDWKQYLYSQFFIDPYFIQFVAFCNKRDIPLAIVSDGLDFYIQQMLKNANIYNIAVYSNLTSFNGDQLIVAFPPLPDDCSCGTCANCKLAVCRKYRMEFPESKLIYAGDGFSDRRIINEVDMIFAKNELAKYCTANQISYIPFDSFGNILTYLKSLAKSEII